MEDDDDKAIFLAFWSKSHLIAGLYPSNGKSEDFLTRGPTEFVYEYLHPGDIAFYLRQRRSRHFLSLNIFKYILYTYMLRKKFAEQRFYELKIMNKFGSCLTNFQIT